MRDFCTYRGVFGDGPSNAAKCIFPRPTPVAMATKFGTKLAITRLAYEIFAPTERFSRLQRGFRGWAIKCCQSHFLQPTPVAMATKFGTKWAITRLE